MCLISEFQNLTEIQLFRMITRNKEYIESIISGHVCMLFY